MCGEQISRAYVIGEALGSPPRVRGTERQILLWRLWLGITPACAGNRICNSSARIDRKDHPRVCGEQTLR